VPGAGGARSRRALLAALAVVTSSLIAVMAAGNPALASVSAPTTVPGRIADHSSGGWPPVLVYCAIVVAGGGLAACVVFMRQARAAARGWRRPPA